MARPSSGDPRRARRGQPTDGRAPEWAVVSMPLGRPTGPSSGTFSPGEWLDLTHRQLRRGDFGQQLLQRVTEHHSAWVDTLAPVERLRAMYVSAEVLDYFGKYDEAATLLSQHRSEGAAALPSPQPDVWKGDHALLKRRLWVAMAEATVLYRRDDYSAAQAQLGRCEALIALPEAPSLLGTRARLSHAQGQVFRQQHEYDKARDAFRTAMVHARLRFAAKTPDAEQREIDDSPFGASAEQFEDHRLLCHWTVGKCLALGLGWIDYTTGQLSSASGLLSAGYALLRATGDVVHRAYATLLIGAVERARAGDDEAGLEAAIAILRDGSSVLRAHPRFSLRVSFELALAYYRLPKYKQQALEEIRILKTHFDSSSSARSARWHSAVLVIESRMMRRAKHYDRAESSALLAIRLAEKARGPADRPADVLAEASIALAETQLARADSGIGEVEASNLRRSAISRLQRALSHCGDNAKIRAVCELHLAHAHSMAGAYLDAQLARARAADWLRTVEHGFVLRLADRVDHSTEAHGAFFLDGRTASLSKLANFERFEVFLIRQAMARRGSQWFELLGLAQRGGTEALKRLRARGHVFEKFKSGPKG